MSTDQQQATLDTWTAPEPEPDADPSGSDERPQQASSGLDGQCAELAEIFENVTGDAEFVEPQEETPSHDPIEGESDVDLTDDGLGDAADSDLKMGGWI